MAARLRTIILGAPGSGKGTISNRIIKEFQLKHLSSGDILRKNIENKTALGLEAKQYVDKGALLPDNMITNLMVNEIRNLDKKVDWLLDGFPRTLPQARHMDESKIQPDAVVNLNVPFEEIANRLKHRWIHGPSGRVYNLEYNPPKVPFKDDITGEPLIQREDDKPETVIKRLKVYEQQTKPIIDFYAAKGLAVTFTGNTSDYLWPLVRAHLQNLKNSDDQQTGAVTHTGQSFQPEDYRTLRFAGGKPKLVNERFAIDYIREDPVVLVDGDHVYSNSGGALGHPKVYINLAKPEVNTCGYSGRKFIQKKFYDESKHGKSISYDEYLVSMKNEM